MNSWSPVGGALMSTGVAIITRLKSTPGTILGFDLCHVDPILRQRVDGDGRAEDVPDREVHVGPLPGRGHAGLEQDPSRLLIGHEAAGGEAYQGKISSLQACEVGLPHVSRRAVVIVVVTHGQKRHGVVDAAY